MTKPQALRKALEKVRASGYAVDQQEAEIGICCASAPIVGVGGEVMAAISISGPSERLEQKGLETRLTSAVQATAARISQAISPSPGAGR